MRNFDESDLSRMVKLNRVETIPGQSFNNLLMQKITIEYLNALERKNNYKNTIAIILGALVLSSILLLIKVFNLQADITNFIPSLLSKGMDVFDELWVKVAIGIIIIQLLVGRFLIAFGFFKITGGKPSK